MKFLKKESGFSLIEVVAAIMIIGIVLLSFSQLFIQTNKIAHKNNEKLTTINLADAMLVRLKSEPFSYDPAITDVNDYFIDPKEQDPLKKKPQTLIKMNEKEYEVSYVAKQHTQNHNHAGFTEYDLKLVTVIVTVTAPDGKIKSSSEGYVVLE